MLLSSEEEAILFVIIPIKAQSTPRSCAQEAKLLPSIGTALLKRKGKWYNNYLLQYSMAMNNSILLFSRIICLTMNISIIFACSMLKVFLHS